jgi:hypothetical protein
MLATSTRSSEQITRRIFLLATVKEIYGLPELENRIIGRGNFAGVSINQIPFEKIRYNIVLWIVSSRKQSQLFASN